MKEIELRRSIRKYLNKSVEKDKILKLIESARLAPSGSNTQPWNFVIITENETKKSLISADHNQNWMLDAPVFIVCVADISCRIQDTKGIYLDENSPQHELKQIIRDTAIAIENLLLEAEHIGLSACWTAWFEQKDIRDILDIPNDKYVCGIVSIGYADERPNQRSRRMLKDMIHYEMWGNLDR